MHTSTWSECSQKCRDLCSCAAVRFILRSHTAHMKGNPPAINWDRCCTSLFYSIPEFTAHTSSETLRGCSRTKTNLNGTWILQWRPRSRTRCIHSHRQTQPRPRRSPAIIQSGGLLERIRPLLRPCQIHEQHKPVPSNGAGHDTISGLQNAILLPIVRTVRTPEGSP